MSLYYQMWVELELVEDISERDLDGVRWVFGLAPEPDPIPTQIVTPELPLEPLVFPDEDGEWLRAPGGASAQLKYGRRPAPEGSTRFGWSVGARNQLHDDHLYGSGALQTFDWLATLSETQGLIAILREENSLVPDWWFYSFDRIPYMLSKGDFVPGLGDAAPAAPAVRRKLREELQYLATGEKKPVPPARTTAEPGGRRFFSRRQASK